MARLYYFSGTGNARNVAYWMAAAWRARGREAEVVDLARVEPGAVRIDAGDEVGLASPTHGFNFPPITLGFVFAFPRAPARNRAFIVNTRAGVRFFGADGSTLAAQGDRHVLGTARALTFRNGYFDQSGEIWSDAEALLASTHQMVYFRE